MRALEGFCIALLFAAGLCAQNRGGATPFITGGFGSVVHPGGTPANTPGLVRSPANVAFPGGGGPQLRVPFSPFSSGFRRSARSNSGFIYSYPYPVFVGGGYGGGYYDASGYGAGYIDPSAMAAAQPPVAPAAPPAPIIINIGVPGAAAPPPPQQGPPEASAQPQEDNSAPEPTHYLIALKDHTIYSALAYWVEGGTLHYFTSGNVHNQVSLSLVDRDLTDRLNRETGVQVNLPR
jgi:hypothetical protein